MRHCARPCPQLGETLISPSLLSLTARRCGKTGAGSRHRSRPEAPVGRSQALRWSTPANELNPRFAQSAPIVRAGPGRTNETCLGLAVAPAPAEAADLTRE